MNAYRFPLDEYLARIGYGRVPVANLAQLEALQRAQVYTVPFENLDIQLGREIVLDPARVDDKIIRQRRGGYCFELNSLFMRALITCGFTVRKLLARVHVTGTPSGRGHQLSLVTVNDRQWIVDVGFGSACPRAPLPFEMHSPQDQDGRKFQLVPHALGYLLQVEQEGAWKELYSFDLGEVLENDIAYGNYYTSTSPRSIFTSARVVSLCHPEGQTLLHNYRCTIVRGASTQVEHWPDSPQYLDALRQHFGIELGSNYAALQPIDSAC
jgi:N-hydroxyarylamine O-acetyltransferase